METYKFDGAVVESADTRDLKSREGNLVRVQVPPAPPYICSNGGMADASALEAETFGCVGSSPTLSTTGTRPQTLTEHGFPR